MGGRGGSSHHASAGGGSAAFDFLRRAYGANHANAVRAILQNAPEHIRSMWDDFSGQFRATSMGRNERGAFYAPADDMRDRSDISDMFEGAGIGKAYPLGSGHGTNYWSGRDSGKEIFAEITSAEAAHPGSLMAIKEYFPKTYKVYQDMLKARKKK